MKCRHLLTIYPSHQVQLCAHNVFVCLLLCVLVLVSVSNGGIYSCVHTMFLDCLLLCVLVLVNARGITRGFRREF